MSNLHHFFMPINIIRKHAVVVTAHNFYKNDTSATIFPPLEC